MANIIKLVDHDYLGACLDVANSICAGEWPDETIDCLSDHTINNIVHCMQILTNCYEDEISDHEDTRRELAECKEQEKILNNIF